MPLRPYLNDSTNGSWIAFIVSNYKSFTANILGSIFLIEYLHTNISFPVDFLVLHSCLINLIIIDDS